MKAFIFGVIILSILLCAIIANSFYVSRVCGEISELALLLESSPDASRVNDLSILWDNCRQLLSYSIRANEIELMETLIESLKSTIDSDNPAEFKKSCRLVSSLALELSSYEKLSLESIF